MSTVIRSETRTGDASDPSAWSHRVPIILLASLGCALATYLTLYQWHITASVWDPIFGAASSEAVLTSAIARRLPVPDATLGAVGYLIEAIITALGGRQRWRTAPRLVIATGVVLAGLALTSTALIVVQAVVVHAWCALCLCSAAISIVNAWLGQAEVRATLGWLRSRRA